MIRHLPLIALALGAACSEATPSLSAVPPQLEAPQDAPLVAFVGDSITAGLHVDDHLSYSAVLQQRLIARGTPFRRIQAGVSGDTSRGGVERIDWILKQAPDIVVVELGGNDGLRGVPLDSTEQNLRSLLTKIIEAGSTPLLLGMRIPENYGDYAKEFDAIYPRLAEDLGVAFQPFFMEGVGGVPSMNVEDQLHPNPTGHARLADNLERELERVLSADQ